MRRLSLLSSTILCGLALMLGQPAQAQPAHAEGRQVAANPADDWTPYGAEPAQPAPSAPNAEPAQPAPPSSPQPAESL